MFKTTIIALAVLGLVFAESSFLAADVAKTGNSELVNVKVKDIAISGDCLDDLTRINTIIEDISEQNANPVDNVETLEMIEGALSEILDSCVSAFSSPDLMDCSNAIEGVDEKILTNIDILVNHPSATIAAIVADSLIRMKDMCTIPVADVLCEEELSAKLEDFQTLVTVLLDTSSTVEEITKAVNDAERELKNIESSCTLAGDVEVYNSISTYIENAILSLQYTLDHFEATGEVDINQDVIDALAAAMADSQVDDETQLLAIVIDSIELSGDCLTDLSRVNDIVEQISELYVSQEEDVDTLTMVNAALAEIVASCVSQQSSPDVMDCTNAIEGVQEKIEITIDIITEHPEVVVAAIDSGSLQRIKDNCIMPVAEEVCDEELNSRLEDYQDLLSVINDEDSTVSEITEELGSAIRELKTIQDACTLAGDNESYNSISDLVERAIKALEDALDDFKITEILTIDSDIIDELSAAINALSGETTETTEETVEAVAAILVGQQ